MYLTAMQIAKENICGLYLPELYYIEHVGEAIENITEFKLLRNINPLISASEIITEIQEMDLHRIDKEEIIYTLSTKKNKYFVCRYMLKKFTLGQAGFIQHIENQVTSNAA